MISRNKIKFIQSLRKKKTREEEKLYVIEGDKLVREFLNAGMKLRMLAAKPEFIKTISEERLKQVMEIETVTYEELKSISTLTTPHNALAVVPQPEKTEDDVPVPDGLSAALDCIQDPGNLGTIIRAAAWFGIRYLYCSPDSVDIYNSKVIQASMGAVLHTEVRYTDLAKLLSRAREKDIPVYGTMLGGSPLPGISRPDRGIILLGNESKGISEELIPFITEKILIPGTGSSKPGIDSLNVGMAASIVFYELTRSLPH